MIRLSTLSLLLMPMTAHAAQQCSASTAMSQPPHLVPERLPPGQGNVPSALRAVTRTLSQAEIETSPALTQIASRGAVLSDLGSIHGMRGVFARNGNRFQVFYVTPDQTAVIGGVMWDAGGHDITRDQVEPIEGAIPTVTYDATGAAARSTTSTPTAAVLDHVTYGLAGRAGAPRVWMFVDPLCPFSVRAMGKLRPYIDAGQIQLALVPVSINDHENNGSSTIAALALLNQPQAHMVSAWTDNTAGAPPMDPGPATALANNMAAAEAIHLQGTPTVIWTASDGSSHQEAGLPDDLALLLHGRPL